MQSSAVTAGQSGLATQYNLLRTDASERIIQVGLNGSVALTTSDREKIRIPSFLNGMNLVTVAANCGTDNTAGSSSSGTPTLSVQKGTLDMLLTNPVFSVGGYEPSTAAVIKSDGSQTVATDNIINVEVVAAGTGVTYMIVTLVFRIP